MIRSDLPGPYASAVSSIVIPSSIARSISLGATSVAYASPYPHSRLPNCQVPNPMRESRIPSISM